MNTATKRKLIALLPPPSKRELQMLDYRAKLMNEAWEMAEPFAGMKLTELQIKHPDIERAQQLLFQRVCLLTVEIEKEREARGIFRDVPQAASASA